MTIDYLNFTPWQSLFGGILIGVASALLILGTGRIAGISGILGGLLTARPGSSARRGQAATGDISWRVMFLLGLVVAPMLYALFTELPVATIAADWPTLVVAGLLVGVGTRYGSGCTSGHGVSGLSRLSPRSLVATLSFMGAGFAVVYVVRHALGA